MTAVTRMMLGCSAEVSPFFPHNLIHWYPNSYFINFLVNQIKIFCDQCSSNTVFIALIFLCTAAPEEPVDYSVRLTGQSPNVGRVEVYKDLVWNAVCYNNNWGRSEGMVICRQLGYKGLLNTYPTNAYGTSTRGLELINISCSGSEDNLSSCKDSSGTIVTASCQHIAVICSGKSWKLCQVCLN